ncbi:MAG: hypothetical protein KGS72_27760, partial [Cyanobacteria bacterium REEB67]|nr:hypothetical protein [Cyanobacteria bacterium REEB67]
SEVLLSDSGKKARVFSVVRMTDGNPLMVMTVHPGIPLNGKAFVSRNSDLQIYVKDLQTFNGPKIIAGDFNCTPWSYYFQKLLNDGRLVDSEHGFGPQASWSIFGFFMPLLPIDHCLVSREIVVTDRKIEKNAGSDHRPLLVRFSVPRRPEEHR